MAKKVVADQSKVTKLVKKDKKAKGKQSKGNNKKLSNIDVSEEASSLFDKVIDSLKPTVVNAINSGTNKGVDKIKTWLE